MLSAIVRWSLSRPRLVAVAALLLLIYGLSVLTHAKYDVFPEFVPAQAEVQTEAPGLSAEQVEQLVTRPVEQAVNGAAGVAEVRSQSIQGISIVCVNEKIISSTSWSSPTVREMGVSVVSGGIMGMKSFE